MLRVIHSFIAAALLISQAAGAGHPHLLFPPSAEATMKSRIAKDPLAKAIFEVVTERAETALTQRTCEYLRPDGVRLLGESRHALHQILHCGMAWRLTGEDRFRLRVIRELDAAAALKDWNPSHFLDTAEMATAVSIGYDWLWTSLTEIQRKRYEDALMEKGLVALESNHLYTSWWTGPKNNWSQVCATGMAFAADMVRHRDPKAADRIYRHAVELMESCVKFYEPEGVYPEGAAYWHYATNFHVMLLAQTGARPLPPALRGTGSYMMHLTGPLCIPFNFSDSGASVEIPTPAQSYLAGKSADSAQVNNVRRLLEQSLEAGIRGKNTDDLRYFPLHLLWLPAATSAAPQTVPLSAVFRGEQSLAFFRSGWREDAAWFAIKGGTGATSHGQLDAGTFVYDALGLRWFHDLGNDNYNLPNYFGHRRWSYFRLNNRSHSTLVIGDQLQAATFPGAPILAFRRQGSRCGVVIDLAPVYPGQATSLTRTARFDESDGAVELIDHLTHPAGPVRWAAVTRAKAKIDGRELTLEQSGKTLVLSRLDDHGGPWEEYPLTPDTPEERSNDGCRMIGFTVKPAATLDLRVAWKPHPHRSN
jgi:hypothetical protein